MKKIVKTPKKIGDMKDPFLVTYIHFIYKAIGKKLLKNKRFNDFFKKKIYNKKYELILKKSNLRILPEEYFISILINISGIVLLLLVLSLFYLFINTIVSMILFYGGMILVFIIGVLLYDFPIYISKKRGKEIDASMPYLLPYMKILAKEINLSKIVEIIDDFLIYKEIKMEFRKIKYYSSFLGYDIHSSIRMAMLSCPSRELSDLMNDLVTISNSGGSIYSYLERKLDNLNTEIKAIEEKNIETLLIYSQVYVVLLLISPLFFTIMSAILNLINFSGGLSVTSTNTFSLIVWMLIFLPFAYLVFISFVYYSKPLYSRLTPIKE